MEGYEGITAHLSDPRAEVVVSGHHSWQYVIKMMRSWKQIRE